MVPIVRATDATDARPALPRPLLHRVTDGHPRLLSPSDVSLKEFIRALDEAQPASERFIISDLGDRPALFVREAYAEFVAQKVKEYLNKLHYEPPARKD